MQADLHGKVQIGPYVEDMPAAYMLADVVVATGGTRRGFSRTLIEAQAMGRPVVAEEGGGAAEAVRPGITGWLAALADAASLAQAIDRRSRCSAERRGELARAAQEHVRSTMRWRTATSACCALYERLAETDDEVSWFALRAVLVLATAPAQAQLSGPPAGGPTGQFLGPPTGNAGELPRRLGP